MRRYLQEEVEIKLDAEKAHVVRKGWRSTLDCKPATYDLSHYLGGQIPYFYREPQKIAADFSARHNALEMVVDLATRAPTSPKFQQSHCGEILCALYLEDVLKFRRLYSKLTLTTAENTNVHKMDGFFVDLSSSPHTYIAVEAKSSIIPTPKTRFGGHRHGILKQMIESLGKYGTSDERFDFTLIRDNLETFAFNRAQQEQIRGDLVPPGPQQLIHLGMATINETTLCPEDDHFILCEACQVSFDFRSIVVVNLEKLAEKSYRRVQNLKKAGQNVQRLRTL